MSLNPTSIVDKIASIRWYLIKLGVFIDSRWNWEVKMREKDEQRELLESPILWVTER